MLIPSESIATNVWSPDHHLSVRLDILFSNIYIFNSSPLTSRRSYKSVKWTCVCLRQISKLDLLSTFRCTVKLSYGYSAIITVGDGTTSLSLSLLDLFHVYSSSHTKPPSGFVPAHHSSGTDLPCFALYPGMITEKLAVSDLDTERWVVHDERLCISWLS